MDEKQPVLIGGVPEHFNAPWHYAIETQQFTNIGLDVVFNDYPHGTGSMCRALHRNELDLAIVVTEGIIADIINHPGNKLLTCFVESPLSLGVFVANSTSYSGFEELRGKRFAISRLGGNAHLMSCWLARQQGWDPQQDLHFIEIGDIKQLIKAIANGQADVLIWDKFTVQPFTTTKTVRCLREFNAPWPAFMLAIRHDVFANRHQQLQQLLQVIQSTNQQFNHNANRILPYIAKRYNLKTHVVETLLQEVYWSSTGNIEEAPLQQAMGALLDIGMIKKIVPATQLVAS